MDWLAFFGLRSTFATYDTGKPWLVYHYTRPDWIAAVLGQGEVTGECLICGKSEKIHFPFARLHPQPGCGLPARNQFVARHAHENHPGTLPGGVLLWAYPLGNPSAFR